MVVEILKIFLHYHSCVRYCVGMFHTSLVPKVPLPGCEAKNVSAHITYKVIILNQF